MPGQTTSRSSCATPDDIDRHRTPINSTTAAVDLAPLATRATVRRLSLSHIASRTLDLAWVPPAFQALTIHDAPHLARLDLAAFAASALAYLHITDCPALEALDFSPLARLSAVGTGARYLDVTLLAGIATLEGFDADGKDAPCPSATAAIASPLFAAGKPPAA